MCLIPLLAYVSILVYGERFRNQREFGGFGAPVLLMNDVVKMLRRRDSV